jgi:hypothetical protein
MKEPDPLCPILLTAAAQALVALGEDERMVKCVLEEVHVAEPGARWDAAFVHHVGYWSHYDDLFKRSGWPLPATKNVEELAQYCGTNGLFRRAPLEGDLFLQRNPAQHRWVRTGIVAHAVRSRLLVGDHPCWDCVTIEAHCDKDALGDRTCVLRRHRTLSLIFGDHFVRWTALDNREERQRVIEEALEDIADPTRVARGGR